MYTRYLERGDKLYENSPKIAQHLLIIALTTIRASRAAGMNFPTGPRADGRVRVTRASTIVPLQPLYHIVVESERKETN